MNYVNEIESLNRFFVFTFRNPNWWKRRTGLERALFLISIVCSIALIVLIVSLVSVIMKEKMKEGRIHRLIFGSRPNSNFRALEPMKSTAEALSDSPRIHVITAETSKDFTKSGKKDEDVCLTPGCVHAASKMLEQMDQSIEPCDDFYSFACGQFAEDTIIPDDKVSVNAFSVISDKLQEQLRTIITAPVEDDEIEPFKMVKKLYMACMNKSEFHAERR